MLAITFQLFTQHLMINGSPRGGSARMKQVVLNGRDVLARFFFRHTRASIQDKANERPNVSSKPRDKLLTISSICEGGYLGEVIE